MAAGERLPGWRVAVAASLAFYLDAATLISVAIALPVWRQYHDLTTWQVGLLGSGLTLAVAVGSALGGRLGDLFGRGLVFTIDLAVLAAGIVLMTLAADASTLLLGVIIAGVAAGADVPTALAVISDNAPTHLIGRFTALTQVAWTLAILVTYTIGFAVAGLGQQGAQILGLHVLAVAVFTLALRLTLTRETESSRTNRPTVSSRATLRSAGAWPATIATGTFLVFWNLASTTLGSYGPYLLVTITGLTQSQATGLVLATFPLALVMSLVFTRLADSPWRDRLFVFAMLTQIAAFATGAFSGGTAAVGMLALIVLYSLSNVFAGEAIYRVWSQLLLPAQVRSTAIGLTYGSARTVAAAGLLVVPELARTNPAGLLWLLCGCVTVSGALGLTISKRRSWQGLLRTPRPTLSQ